MLEINLYKPKKKNILVNNLKGFQLRSCTCVLLSKMNRIQILLIVPQWGNKHA